MRLIILTIATTLASAALAAPLHAQHAGHGAPASTDAHAGHGAPAVAAPPKEHMSGWKELDAYHMVMMRVWHPAKAKGDLTPIRAHARALAAGADSLQKGAIPAACDTPANRQLVAAVHRDSHALAGLSADGSDAAVLEALRALHDRFEVVNHACKAG